MIATAVEPSPMRMPGLRAAQLFCSTITWSPGFKPDAKMSDISAFLGSNGLKIIGGPTADGVFRLAIPAANAADYAKQLSLIAAQPFADTVIEGRKPADGG